MTQSELNTRKKNKNTSSRSNQASRNNSNSLRYTRNNQTSKYSSRTPKYLRADKPFKVIVGTYDFSVLLTVMLLALFGIIMVFSSSYYTTGNSAKYSYDMYYFLKRHVIWAFIGFMSLIFMNNFNYEHLKKYSLFIYITSNFLLLLVIAIGTSINGAKRWIQLGPISIQPSEIAKISLILYLSYFISNHKKLLNTWRGFFTCSAIVLVPTILAGIENMSTALVIAAVGMSIIFIASPKLRYFVLAAIGGVSGITAMLLFGEQFRMARFQAWKDPFSDPRGIGYQIIQALYAIASGGLFGLGLGQSRQKLGYIPEGHNDIIFAIICEELGLFGASILILLFIILIWRGVTIAINSIDLFGCLISTGITVMIAIQVIINIGVVTNTFPNTGIPLPFISYGGTSLLFMMTSIGVLLNISRYYKE